MRAGRMLLTVGLVVAVLAVAVIVGVRLNQRQEDVAAPSASPSPSASSAPVAIPSPSGMPCVGSCGATGQPAAIGSIYNDDFGFVISDSGTSARIRRESTFPTPFVGAFAHQGFAVSPDGTQIAYWTPKSAGQPSTIQIASAANPQALGASSGLGTDENGGVIVWANDSSGVAYAVLGPGQTPSSVIRTFNTRSGNAGPGRAVIASVAGTRVLQPIAWDRAANLLAVGATGGGGFMTDYIVASTAEPQGAPKGTPITGRVIIASVRASTDAKFIVGTDIDSGFSYWPLADYAAKVTPAESKYASAGALWRPGTHEIGFIGPSDQFWLCNVERNTPLGCGVTAFSGAPARASLRMFRADGSAVLLAVDGGPGAPTSYTLVKLTGDPFAAKATGGDRVAFIDVGGLIASVRLR